VSETLFNGALIVQAPIRTSLPRSFKGGHRDPNAASHGPPLRIGIVGMHRSLFVTHAANACARCRPGRLLRVWPESTKWRRPKGSNLRRRPRGRGSTIELGLREDTIASLSWALNPAVEGPQKGEGGAACEATTAKTATTLRSRCACIRPSQGHLHLRSGLLALGLLLCDASFAPENTK
jgi:hypothetical protein